MTSCQTQILPNLTQHNLTTYLILKGNFFLVFFSYLVVVDEDEPVVNQSIVQEVVEASQRSFSQDLCKFTQLQIILLAETSRARACLWFCNTKLPESAISLQVVTTPPQPLYPPHPYSNPPPIPTQPPYPTPTLSILSSWPNSLLVFNYISGWREPLLEESVSPKNTTQWPWSVNKLVSSL